MENTKDNKNINLVKSQKLYQSMMKLHFKDGFPFLKELFPADMPKTEIKMKKLLCPGQAIFNLSKTFTY